MHPTKKLMLFFLTKIVLMYNIWNEPQSIFNLFFMFNVWCAIRMAVRTNTFLFTKFTVAIFIFDNW